MGDLTLRIADDRANDGPAMSCLTDDQRAFVIAYTTTVGKDGKPSSGRAAKAAGLSEGYGAALLRKRTILAAIAEETDLRISAGRLMAIHVIESIATNATHKDQFGAAKWLAALNGLQPAQKVDVAHSGQVEHVVVDNRERIKRLAERLSAIGKDPVEVFAAAGIIIDAEFEVVAPGQQVALPAPEEWSVA